MTNDNSQVFQGTPWERNERLLKQAQEREDAAKTLNNGELFAGMQEGALGEIFAYFPTGEVNIDKLNLALAVVGKGLPPMTLKALLGLAVRSLAGTYNVQAAAKGRSKGQRWQISTKRRDAEVGQSSGIVTVTVMLTPDDLLHFEGADSLKQVVLAEIQRLRDGNIMKGPNAQTIVDGIFYGMGGVRSPWGWFVPKSSLDIARKFSDAMRQVWGHWAPTLPVTNIDAFKAGIREGLESEILGLKEKTETEIKEGMTPRVAVNRLADVNAMAERLEQYSAIIGPGHVRGLKTDLNQIRTQLDELADDTTQRGAVMWEEVYRSGGVA